METILLWLDGSNIPSLTAFLLGIITAISPCPLATNITAIGFISKDIENRDKIFWSGMLYTLGRIATYMAIGAILIPILREGASIFKIQKAISNYGELLLAPALILIGLFMLFGSKLRLPSFGYKGDSESGESLKRRGGIGALLLGVLFALAFCPTSAIFYFGMLIPMSAGANGAVGYLYPLIFAIATGLPVIIVAWLLAYSVSGVGRFYNNIRTFQRWFNLVVALLFIAVGIYYGVMLYL